MSFNFPNSPTNGQEFEAIPNGLTFVYSNGTWIVKNVEGMGAAITSDSPPGPPLATGQLWWESDSGLCFIWYDDQWVQIQPMGIGEAPQDGFTYGRQDGAWTTVVGGAVIADVPPGPPLQSGQLFWESDSGDMFIWYDDGSSAQWVQVNGPALPSVSIGDAPPASPVHGNMWWNSASGRLYTYYNDGTSSQWTHIAGPLAAKTGQWELLSTQESVANALQAFNFDAFPDPALYDTLKWEWEITAVSLQIAGVYPYIRMRIGGVDQTGATAYGHNHLYIGTGGGVTGYGSTLSGAPASVIALAAHTSVPDLSSGAYKSDYEITMSNPRLYPTKTIPLRFSGSWYTASNIFTITGSGFYGGIASSFNGMAFRMGGANMTAKIKMWGRRI